jgi:hypothetical protein
MKLDVQDALFSGLGTRLGRSAHRSCPPSVGPGRRRGELNTMGKNALTAVSNLRRPAQLKKVFDGVRSSLGNLSRIPGQLVTGFAQLSVAAQPAFDRMTPKARPAPWTA